MDDPVSEQLVTLVQVLLEDPPLREWFTGLQALNPAKRADQLTSMAAKMRTDREDQELILALETLRYPAVFDGVACAVREL